MKREKTVLALILALSVCLAACGTEPAPPSDSNAPGRMVRSIEVAIHPEDPDFARTYVTLENMNALLTLLRSMETETEPEQEPDINGGQSLYTATVTFANGQQSIYYLLGHTYLRLGDDDWCVISTDLSKQFTDFIREHPSDNGPAAIETTTAPTETTAPPETTVPTE